MSRIINAYNKIDYIDHAIVANSKSVDYAYPYNTNLAALYSMKGFVDAKGNVLSNTTAEPLNGTISSFAYVLSNKSLIFDFE